MSPTSDQTGPVVPILSAANFIIGMGAFMLVGLLNPLADDLHMSAAAAGWIMVVYALAYAVLSPLLVSVTGSAGRRRILAIGLSLFTAANAMAALAPNAEIMLLSRVVAAAGAGLMTPVAAAVAAGLSPPEHRARALSVVFFGMTLAQVLGVPVGSFIAYTFGWRAAFWVVSLLALPVIWLIWTRVPVGLKFPPVSLRNLWDVLSDLPQMVAVAFTTALMSATYVVYTYIAPILSGTMGFERDGITAALLVSGIGAVLGNLVSGFVTDRIGPHRTLATLCCALIVILPCFSTLPLPVAWVMALFLIWSLFGFAFMAAQQARLIGLAPQNASVLLALTAAAIYVGAAIGSAIGSVVLDRLGLGWLGVAGGAVAVVALLTLWWGEALAARRRGGAAL